MATQSPFLLLDNLVQSLTANFQSPSWAIEEVQRRIVLLLNHVLMQEKEAMGRLARQKGGVVLVQWRVFTLRLSITPAGLLDLATADASPDLSLSVTDESPLSVARAMAQGGKPAVRIVGDVQLAAEVNWLVDHVRWDLEEDLSRVMGDAPAHAVGQAARRLVRGLRQFAGTRSAADGAGGTTA